MAKNAPMGYGEKFIMVLKKVLFSNLSLKNYGIKITKLLQENKPDLIISTHPFSSQMCAVLKGKGQNNCKIATIMTDFAPHDQWLLVMNL